MNRRVLASYQDEENCTQQNVRPTLRLEPVSLCLSVSKSLHTCDDDLDPQGMHLFCHCHFGGAINVRNWCLAIPHSIFESGCNRLLIHVDRMEFHTEPFGSPCCHVY